MKKFLLSIFAVLFAFAGVKAQSYVKVTSTPSDWSGDYLIVYEDGANAYVFNGKDAVNGYVKTTIANNVIVPSDDVNACSVEIVAMSNGYSIKTISAGYIYGASGSNTLKFNTSQAQLNTIELESNGVKITSNTSVLRFNNASNQMRFRYYKSSSYAGQKAIALYKYTEDAGGEDVVNIAEPTFNPANGTTFEESLGVTITAEDGLTVYYSTDDKKSYKQGNTLNITETTTVYAYAENADGDVSDIVSATYKKVELMTIAEAKAAYDAAGANVEVVIDLAGAVITANYNNGTYVFIQDDEAGIYVYGSSVSYPAGTKFTDGRMTCTSTLYSGLHEITNAVFSNVLTTTTTVEPIVVTVAELNANFDTYEGRYVKLEGVELSGTTITQGEDVYAIFNRFDIALENAAVCDVLGVVTCNIKNSVKTLQIFPTEIFVSEAVVDVAEPEFTPADGTTFDESLDVTINAEDGLKVFYSIDNKNSYIEGNTLTITETTTVYAYAVDTDGNESEVVSVTYIKNEPVTPPAEGETAEVVDVLNRDFTGVKSGSTTYSSWSDKKATSAAVYAGNSAGSNDAIQLRSNNSNSGIVTTVSGGKAKKIVVKWNDNTSSGRILEIYGKNTAYTLPTELYATTGNTEQGMNLGEIVCGTSTELIIEGDYEYIGLRSKSGAMYINEIQITWVVEAEEPTSAYTLSVSDAGYATLFLDFPATIPAFKGEDAGAYIVKGVKDGNWLNLVKIEGVLPANTGIIVKADKGSYEFKYSADEATDVADNLLKGTVVDENITEDAYVLSVGVNGVGLYGAILNQLDGTAWKNNANKAYLPASAVPNKTVAFYGFDWDGTTGINEVKGENGNVKAIFDLTGRRVEEITAPGIYIVNGKKVLVK